MDKNKTKKVALKITKILLWIVGSMLGLFLLLVIALQIPSVQNFAKDKAVNYLESKINTKVSVGKIEIGLPKNIILEEIYLEDQTKDTLLYGKKIVANISLFKLLDNELEINSVNLNGINAKVIKDKNGVFNFDYIIDAFATKEEPKIDEKPMLISLSKIVLDDINISFDDAESKNDFSMKLNHFDTKIKKFDLENLSFDVPKIKLDGLKLQLNQGIAEATAKSTKAIKEEVDSKIFSISNDQIALSNIDITYKQENSKLDTKVKFKELNVDFDAIDLVNQKIKIKKLALNQTDGQIILGQIEKKNIEKEQVPATSKPWEIEVNSIKLNKVNFSFDDNNAKELVKGMDYSHLDLTNLNLDADAIKYTSSLSSGIINSFSAAEKSGLIVNEFRTKFYYSTTASYLKNLYIKTPKTEIKDQIVANYNNISTLSTDLNQLAIKAIIKKSKIAISDILLFVPQLENTKPFSSNKNAIVNIDGVVYGKINNLTIPSIEISGIGNTYASISGKIKGLPGAEKAYYDINIKNIKTTSNDIYSFVPNGVIPATIQLPKELSTKGTFKGMVSNFDVNLLFNSTMGNAKVIANYDQRVKDKEKYNAKAWLDEFNLGALLKNEQLGKLSVQADVKGNGLNPKTATATINSTITKAEFNQYAYHDINLKASLQNGIYNANIDSNDENLKFALVSNGGFKDKYPSVKLNLKLDMADLRKLNLHAGYLKIKGDVDADFDQLDIDNLNGKLNITNTLIALETEQFPLDSINLIATSKAEKNTLKLQSQFATADINGKYKLSTISDALMNSISKYYDLNNNKKAPKIEPQQLDFVIQLKDEPIIQKLVPELKNFSAIKMEGKYNSVNDTIQINAVIPKLNYNENVITNAVLKINKEENALVYSFVVDDLKNPSFQLPYTNLFGKVENNTIDYELQLKDIKNVERYVLAGSLKNIDGNSEVAIKNDNLKLNYQKWNIDDNNVVRIDKKGIYINDFVLSNGSNKLTVNSETKTPNAPINVDFKDFDLNSITSIVESNFEIGGKINGTTKISNLSTSAVVVADLDIENFAVKKDTVGNLNIKIDNKNANIYNASVKIDGFENLVFLDGNYKVIDGTFDLKLNIDKFQMKSIQAFTFGNLTKSNGFLNGKLDINGNTNQPNIDGFLKFNQVGFEVKTLNTKFKLLNDKIDFANKKMIFTDFKLQDENNNKLALEGNVGISDFSNLGLDLSMVANNFNPINSTEKDNDLFYGELYLDNDISIKGSLNKPIVNGIIKINKDTKFSIVLPQTEPSIASREGVVEFIDQDQPILYDQSKDVEKFNQSDIFGIEASVNIEIDKDAEISIVIDKANGDFLKLKGEAELTGGIDASGKTSLTGKYEFTGGAYEMNLNLIKRKFDIKPGSYILWKGEPTLADVNVTAIYKADVAPIDLVADQLGNVTAETRNTYKQKIPFETELKMNGELLQPKVSFDIVLPEGNNSVSAEVISTTKAKLEQIRQQEDVLNKQVFALLLLNRFIGENPFESEAGGISASTLARQSASKILSQQLNNLAGDIISGVELDFDLQSTEDYTSGTKENKTDLNVGLSKKLLNDRLKVTVGSNIGLEGTPRENEQASTIAGDISADYLLTKDGRYKVRAYRKNNYQVALQGQVVETGVAFVITMDYNKFRELFHRQKKDKKAKSKNKKNKSDEKL